jgi:hypothetical protein
MNEVMKKYRRVAIFLDYENLHVTLKKRASTAAHRFGFSPKVDFNAFVRAVEARFGPVQRRDFMVVANFSHYDLQKGGLNQVAELVNVDSFEARTVRQEEQPSPGKKYVVREYADMRLAFEVGKHAATHPADLYLLVTGDKAFAAVGDGLRARGIDVIFVLPDSEKAGFILLEHFEHLDIEELHLLTEGEEGTENDISRSIDRDPEPVDLLAQTISKLRQTLHTAVPVYLIGALVGPAVSGPLLKRAQSQGRIDLWTDPQGVECVSLQEERVYGKVVQQTVRKEIAERAQMIYHVARVAEAGKIDRSRAAWWRAIREAKGCTVREAKQTVEELLETGVLRIDNLDKVFLTMKNVLTYLRASIS